MGQPVSPPRPNPVNTNSAFDAYNSWKLALGTSSATDPATFTVLPGFKAELLRSAQPGEGSWVGMAFDPKGRLTVAREGRGLLRLTLENNSVDRVEVINDTLLECRGLLYAHDALYVNANNSKGFFRLRDTKGTDQFDEIKLLLHTEGNVGHGRNHVVLGPDGALWLIHGNNVTLTTNLVPNSQLQHYTNDSLIPCPFDDAMFDGDVLLPAGHILRTDKDGKQFELFAGGFRNPLDIAFNADGEMFTFDADMEWDVGSPWYRPNRVNHVISGADFGWRRGTSKYPDYFPDTLPSTCDIGLASPTGIEFGTHSRFPRRYQEALFIADWAYGRILAVHLTPNGASYSARSELFLSGRPLNVTDFSFGPDGAMYVITGGRGTQSGLYRISYHGSEIARPTKAKDEFNRDAEAAKARGLRRQLESFHSPTNATAPLDIIETVWPRLGNPDPWIRHAARIALERQEPRLWQQRALEEQNIDVALTAWLALTRVGKADVQAPLLHRLAMLPLISLTPSQQLQVLRLYELAFSRLGSARIQSLQTARQQLEPLYPTHDWHLDHCLCTLLVYLKSPVAIAKTLDLLATAERPEDFMQYLFTLRYARNEWTTAQCEAWFRALASAEQKQGARDYYTVLKRIRDEVLASLPVEVAARMSRLDSKTDPSQKAGEPSAPAPAFVKEWQITDFDLKESLRGRSLARGREAFRLAQCVLCHRFGNEGSLIGPDLSSVASRFDRRAILESILEPSKVIDDKFRNTKLTLDDGSIFIGLVEREDEKSIVIRENPLAGKSIELARQKIVRKEFSPVSPMPAGLVNVLQRHQILDLLAYLEFSGSPSASTLR